MATNKRKIYSDEFKEFLVQETQSSERSIASIAKGNGINQNYNTSQKLDQKTIANKIE